MTTENRNNERRDGTNDGQRRGEHLSAATNKHETVGEPIEQLIHFWFVRRLYSEGQREKLITVESRLEAGSNTFIVALRVAGGDGKRTLCVGVQLGHPVPGGYKYGVLAYRLGESRM
jgi:hypothetical protein